MINPIERYNELKGWIPETDIDGIDAKKEYASYAKNVDFENGFLQGCIAPSLLTSVPTEISSLLTDYEILDAKHFKHSVQGNIIFFVLWKESDKTMKFFAWEVDNDVVIELNIDEQNNDVTHTVKPTIISWGLAEDQLKINLNTTVTYNGLVPFGVGTVILNLTLVYLSERIYQDGVIERAEGWYLFPRWLGWSYKDTTTVGFVNSSGTGAITENFQDDSFITGFVNVGMTVDTIVGMLTRSIYLINDTTDTDNWALFYIEGLQNVKTIDFDFATRGSLYLGITPNTQLIIYLQYTDEDGLIQTIQLHKGFTDDEILLGRITIEANWYTERVASAAKLFFQVNAPKKNFAAEDFTYVAIDNIVLTPAEDIVIVGVNEDNQRALLCEGAVSIYGHDNFAVNRYIIDWRIKTYEIYAKLSSSIYTIMGKAEVDDNWTLSGDNLEIAIPEFTAEEIEKGLDQVTLNFNYGLGATVRVDNQKIISSEAIYKGRTYFVNNNYKVYQSHISGTGRAQPDSFPYDESVEFGYFITGRDDTNLAIAVTNLEELFIIGDLRCYTYYIEGQAGTVFRTLKKNEGAKSIQSINSLVKSLSGNPMSDMLFWADKTGAYIYSGGRKTPTDVVLLTLRNYWKALGNRKDAIIAFYNKPRNEFFICLENEIIVFEPLFNNFKRYVFGFVIKSYIGFFNGIHYFLTDDNGVRVLDTNSTVRMDWEVETHYNSNTVIVGQYPIDAPEHESKIMQEIYIAVKDTVSSVVKYTITADGNVYDEITFTTGMFTDILPSPLLIRYGKVKIKIKVSKLANIREFGYSFTVPNQIPHQQVKKHIQGIGMSSGTDAGIGL